MAGGLLPPPVRRWIWGLTHATPAPGRVNFGHLRRLMPISRHFGYDRGEPIDRYYIERFLEQNAKDIRGQVLEIGDDTYTRRFGEDRVTRAEVLHVDQDAPGATYVGDLENGECLPDQAFDCIILTQTLHLIFNLDAAIATIQRVLKPGGVLLATVPGISQRSADVWAERWCWGFTQRSVRLLFERHFAGEAITTESYGNVLVGIAFLEGLSSAELSKAELNHRDPQYEVLITLRVAK